MSSSCSRPKDAVSAAKDVKTKEETSSDSEDKMAAINKNLSFSKRKPELLMDGGEVVEKRKKGRPRKDKMAAAVAQPFPQVETARKETCRNSTLQQREINVYILRLLRWLLQQSGSPAGRRLLRLLWPSSGCRRRVPRRPSACR